MCTGVCTHVYAGMFIGDYSCMFTLVYGGQRTTLAVIPHIYSAFRILLEKMVFGVYFVLSVSEIGSRASYMTGI